MTSMYSTYILYMCIANATIPHLHFNFCGVIVLWILAFSDFHI